MAKVSKKEKLTWTTKRIKLGRLLEWDKNPARISERDAQALAISLDKYDHVLPYVAAAPMNGKEGLPLLDGHQRKMVELNLLKVSPDTLVDVRIPSRKLTEKERKELAVRLRKNVGEWDNESLLEWFGSNDLLDWGFERWELYNIGFDISNEVDYKKEWEGMPEFENKDLSAIKQITVNFMTLDDYKKFSELIGQSLTEKTRSIWYPEAEKINMRDTYEA